MPIQDQEIPVVVLLEDGKDYKSSISTSFIYDTTDPDTTDVLVTLDILNTDYSLIDTLLEFFLTSNTESSFSNTNDEFFIKDIFTHPGDNTQVTLRIALNNSTIDATKLSFYTTTYLQTFLDNTKVSLRINLGKIPEDGDTPVDVDISGVKYFNCLADIYSSIESHNKQLNIDVQQGLGRITRIDTDLVCSSLTDVFIDTSIYSTALGIAPLAITRHCCSYSSITCSGITCSGITCSGIYPGGDFCAPTYSGLLNLCSTYSGCVYDDLDYCISNTYSGITFYGPTYSGCIYENLDYHVNTYPGGLSTELQIAPGRLTFMDVDIFSTKLGIGGGITSDLKTRSLFVGNFFIELHKFTTADTTAWIDLIDYLYPINTNNTCLYINGTMASGIYFEDIPDGKRLLFNPLDDFYSDGVLLYTVHVENIMGEVEEKDYYLLYGYNLQLNEVVDWGPHNKIIVRIAASNLAFCPNIEGEAFDFVTVDLESINLGFSIQPVGYVDLPIQISPQSKAFFYGRTYTIRLKNVKDFAGNIMPDLEYTFTIENP